MIDEAAKQVACAYEAWLEYIGVPKEITPERKKAVEKEVSVRLFAAQVLLDRVRGYSGPSEIGDNAIYAAHVLDDIEE